MKFTKINGNGNNFVVLDNRTERLSDPELTKITCQICRQETGIGGDGILVLEEARRFPFKMRLFNRDGSEGEMCGNGARCFARFVVEEGFTEPHFSFETLAGDVEASVEGRWTSLHLPPIDLSPEMLDLEGDTIRISSLLVGVPHCVVIFGDGADLPNHKRLFDLGRTLRNDLNRFPEGTNVNFLRRIDDRHIEVHTYERGVENITESCGTGSTAGAIVSHFILGTAREVDVMNPGGINHVSFEYDEPQGKIRAVLSGKTTIVASGTLSGEWLEETLR